MSPLDHVNWDLVPSHLRQELSAYLLAGQPPRSRMLAAVLCNDLSEALALSEPRTLSDLVVFLRNYAPSISWGSMGKIREWEANGGLFEREAGGMLVN